MILEEVKAYLNITWDEEDLFLQTLITEAIDFLEEIAGITLDFTNNTNKGLLKDYCRYAYNKQIEYFEENFASKLLRLQIKSALKK